MKVTKTGKTSVRFTEQEKEKIRTMAAEMNITMGEFIRRACIYLIAKIEERGEIKK